MPARKYSALARWVHLPSLKVRNIDVSNEYIDNNLTTWPIPMDSTVGTKWFVVNLKKTLSRLAGFACVEPSELLMIGKNKQPIIGNNMRPRSDALRSVNLDEKWRDKLSADDLKIIRRIAGKHAWKYGYDI